MSALIQHDHLMHDVYKKEVYRVHPWLLTTGFHQLTWWRMLSEQAMVIVKDRVCVKGLTHPRHQSSDTSASTSMACLTKRLVLFKQTPSDWFYSNKQLKQTFKVWQPCRPARSKRTLLQVAKPVRPISILAGLDKLQIP
jgi:hypothetical protein